MTSASTRMTVDVANGIDFKVADLSLAEFGRKEIRLAEHEMPGLMSLRREYADVAPLKGARVSGSLLSPGCRVEGEVSDSVVGPGVVVAAGATVRGSLLLGDCVVPAGAVLDTVVVDVGGAVPAHEVTGRAAPAEEVVVLTPQHRGPAEDETTGSGRPGRSD